MTHPTIEAVASRIGVINASEDYAWTDEAQAAARVILSAPPSEAEVEAMTDAFVDIIPVPSISMDAMTELLIAIRNAANTARRKEMGVE